MQASEGCSYIVWEEFCAEMCNMHDLLGVAAVAEVSENRKCRSCGEDRNYNIYYPHAVARKGQRCLFNVCTFVSASGISCHTKEKKKIEETRVKGYLLFTLRALIYIII